VDQQEAPLSTLAFPENLRPSNACRCSVDSTGRLSSRWKSWRCVPMERFVTVMASGPVLVDAQAQCKT